ncbi:MAG: hypothetical protein SOZ78_01890, partial [Eubacteriales bacterium]|nr:hypothetical protein [Eubacteriales bacterium]
RRQNALQAKKRDIFPAGKVWFSPSAPPPIFPRSGNSLFGSQTKCARQIYSPLLATAKTRDLGRTRTLNINRRQCCSIYLLKKLDSNDFKPKQTAAKFSANIISATVYLFAGSPCSWVVEGADPYGFGQSFLALSVYSQIK